jgi:hypothetical protein
MCFEDSFSPDSNENPEVKFKAQKRLKEAFLRLKKTSFVVRNCSE